jgi:Uma2 family endonuclease
MISEVNEPAPKYRYISPDEYLEMEQVTDERLEYYNGQAIRIEILTFTHNIIQSNINSSLAIFLNENPCQIMGSRMRISTPSRQNYMYADALIYCGKHILEVSKYDTIINPSVILEIQSPSMGGLNKKRKLHFYKEIPSLKEYIIINSQKCHVEVARKQSDGDWPIEEIYDRNGFLFIETIGYHLPLPKIYRNTGL